MTRQSKNRLVSVNLDSSLGPGLNADAEHERQVAIYDLIEDNTFAVVGHDTGPYRLELSTADNRLIFDVFSPAEERVTMIGLSLSPFRRIVKDYFLICESYYKAIRERGVAQVEAIDAGRRSLHNEGAELLIERLAGKVAIDHATARRLFTLLCVLHLRA